MSLWRKRGTSDTVATGVHHNEQKPDHLVNIVTNLSIQSDDLSIKSKKIDDDDDIQAYVKPWVGLTDAEITELRLKTNDAIATNYEIYKAIEQALKDKNT